MTETRNNILHIHVHQNAYDCYSVKTFPCIWETNNRSTYFCLVTANDILSPIWSGSNWLLVSEDHQWPLNPNGNLVILSSWEAARNDQDFFSLLREFLIVVIDRLKELPRFSGWQSSNCIVPREKTSRIILIKLRRRSINLPITHLTFINYIDYNLELILP